MIDYTCVLKPIACNYYEGGKWRTCIMESEKLEHDIEEGRGALDADANYLRYIQEGLV